MRKGPLRQPAKSTEPAGQFRVAILMEQFDTVMPLLKELYRRLRPHSHWTEIGSDFGGRVRGSLNFTVGDGQNPQFRVAASGERQVWLFFSPFTSLVLGAACVHCYWMIRCSISTITVRSILSRFCLLIRGSGHQVIVAVEDTSLADLLCRRLRSRATEIGRRYELRGAPTGASYIETMADILPMSRDVLRLAAS